MQRTTSERPMNVFVLGLDERNRAVLESIPDADRYRFHGVLTYEQIYRERISFTEILTESERILDAFDGPIDAIIGFWDFPVSSIVPLLRRRHGLPTAEVGEIVRCEHKYWSRLLQAEVVDEIPAFGLVDPFEDDRPPAGVDYPLWLKPVKSFASMLAIRVTNDQEFEIALATIRAGIDRLGEPFEALLEHVEVPSDIAAAGGLVCIAEEAIEGHMVTVEGYRRGDEIVVYGIVDSIRHPDRGSFLRYQYPSSVPSAVADRMTDISERVVRAIGLDGTTFNIEFFWNRDTDAVTLLEINPRHSQSHADLFARVDGVSNHEVALDLAFGRRPRLPGADGPRAMAATCFVRHFSDGIVRRHPTPVEVAEIESEFPGVAIEVDAREGDRLSRLHGQDTYSYRLATVVLDAADEAELVARFEDVRSRLRFEIDDHVAPRDLVAFPTPTPPAMDDPRRRLTHPMS